MTETIKSEREIDTFPIHNKINREETKVLLRRIKKESSPGADGITISMINAISDKAFNALCTTMEAILKGEQ